jgi:hypothetical protein
LQSFDAGALVFIGTTTPVTLFPPYSYQPSGGGTPFNPGASLEVQGSGAAGAGFDKFDEKFAATTLLLTSPPLDQIPMSTVFGLGSIPVAWNPGSDTVTITLSGNGGVATCSAQDSSGQFEIPRAAVTAVLGTAGGSSLALSITRERDTWDKSLSAHGMLTGATVQPVAWLEVSTFSSESATFQGCPGTETQCPDGCFDTSSDPLHCGSCTVVCAANQSCISGQCSQ